MAATGMLSQFKPSKATQEMLGLSKRLQNDPSGHCPAIFSPKTMAAVNQFLAKHPIVQGMIGMSDAGASKKDTNELSQAMGNALGKSGPLDRLAALQWGQSKHMTPLERAMDFVDSLSSQKVTSRQIN